MDKSRIMKHEVQEALDEILDMAPMFRRDVIVSYLRRNLPEEEARKLYFKKDMKGYMNKMVRGGYLRQEELLEAIGRERVIMYISHLSRLS